MKHPAAILCVLVTVTLFSCQKEKQEKTPEQDEVQIPVQLTEVKTSERTEPVHVAGTVASLEEARLSFKTGGIIQKILFREGQQVRKGQLLATLDLTEIKAQVSQARLSWEKAERDMNRIQKMLDDTAATLEQFQNSKTGFEVARQNLDMAEFNLAHSRILSPIDGVVTRKVMNEGEMTGPGSVVLIVNANRRSDWVVHVGVSDRDWARLTTGNRANVQLDAYPDQVFEGQVSQMAQSADPATRLYEIEIKLLNPAVRMASGMFAKAELLPSISKNYKVIPVEALIEGHGKEGFVFIDQQGKARKKAVTIGYLDGDHVLISKGLDSIDAVITAGSAFLTDGASIQVSNENSKQK